MRRIAGILACIAAAGCHTDMWKQNKIEPLEESRFYADGATARPLVPGTVPRDHLRLNQPFFTGFRSGKLVTELPVPVTKDLLERGQERYNVFCSPCHGMLGNGDGMIAQRGLALRRPPATYHTDRLRKMPVGHFYDVQTRGYGVMFSYASRIEPRDRWAIAAYIRALQLSQNAPAGDVDPTDLSRPAADGAHPTGGGH